MMRGLGLLLILGVACGSGDPIPKVESIPKVEDLTTEAPTVPCLGINCPTTFVPPTLPCVADYCPTESTTPLTTETSSTETPTTQTTTTEAPTTQTQTTQTPTTQPSTQPPNDIRRTVVFVFIGTGVGDFIFIRGARETKLSPGCEDYTSPCAIPIQVKSLGTTTHYDSYNAWRVGDDKLDWGGAQPDQGTYSGKSASGTPMAWTSKFSSSPGYQELNIWGDHHWMVDMEMDCAQTDDGWFELKAIKLGGNVEYPEKNITQPGCIGTAAATPPYTSDSHMARCGYINKFTFDQGFCEMYSF